jgi:hypothetical protein
LGSDNLITEAAGGNVSAQALKEADEKAFQESEVNYISFDLHFYRTNASLVQFLKEY